MVWPFESKTNTRFPRSDLPQPRKVRLPHANRVAAAVTPYKLFPGAEGGEVPWATRATVTTLPPLYGYAYRNRAVITAWPRLKPAGVRRVHTEKVPGESGTPSAPLKLRGPGFAPKARPCA